MKKTALLIFILFIYSSISSKIEAQQGFMMHPEKKETYLIGTDAKDFETTNLDGNPIHLSELKGTVVVINFWDVYCKPCVKEMPELNEIVEKFKGQNVKFIAIATDSKDQVKTFLKKKKNYYDIVADGRGRRIEKLYNVYYHPTNCIIDQNGKIQYFDSGYKGPETSKNIENKISSLLKG